MTLLIIALIMGPVGDYFGLDYEFFIYSEGYDSSYQIGSDTGDVDVSDSSIVIDTLTYQGYPAYLQKHFRDSDLFGTNDTTISWEVGDSLFTWIDLFGTETLPVKIYEMPLTVGLNWDLGIAGDTIIFDMDEDGIDDTLLIADAQGTVTDSLSMNVPLGTFDAFKSELLIFLPGWMSSTDDSFHLWLHVDRYIVPYLGSITDSVVIEDSIRTAGHWIWAMTMIQYHAAVDTGYIGIAEQPDISFGSIRSITNGIRIVGNGNYKIEIYNIIGRMHQQYDLMVNGVREIKPELPAGIYFARIKQKDNLTTTKFLILK